MKVTDVEVRWIKLYLHFVPIERRRYRRSGSAPNRIRSNNGLYRPVSEGIEIDTFPATRDRVLNRQLLWMRGRYLAHQRFRERQNLVGRGTRPDRHQDAQTSTSRRLGVRNKFQSIEGFFDVTAGFGSMAKICRARSDRDGQSCPLL